MPLSELERERAIQTLCTHYANDNLSTDELEARFDLAYKAASPTDLEQSLANLPLLSPAVASGSARLSTPLYAMSHAAEPPTERRTLAFMSEVKKVGEWIPARRNVVRAVMGSAELDFREALLSQGEIEVSATAIMGEVKLIIPPGLRVECDGTAIMGEFKEFHSAGGEDPTAPLIRIHGIALMGSVTVTTRLPGESAMAAWRRRRRERVRG